MENEPWAWDDRGFEMNFAVQMSERRRAKGWSQTELAKRVTEAGVKFHQTTVQRIESGERPLRLTEALAIAEALDAKFETMLRGDSIELVYNELVECVKAGSFDFIMQNADAIETRVRRSIDNARSFIQSYESAIARYDGDIAVNAELIDVANAFIDLNELIQPHASTLASYVRSAANRFNELPRNYPVEFDDRPAT